MQLDANGVAASERSHVCQQIKLAEMELCADVHAVCGSASISAPEGQLPAGGLGQRGDGPDQRRAAEDQQDGAQQALVGRAEPYLLQRAAPRQELLHHAAESRHGWISSRAKQP